MHRPQAIGPASKCAHRGDTPHSCRTSQHPRYCPRTSAHKRFQRIHRYIQRVRCVTCCQEVLCSHRAYIPHGCRFPVCSYHSSQGRQISTNLLRNISRSRLLLRLSREHIHLHSQRGGRTSCSLRLFRRGIYKPLQLILRNIDLQPQYHLNNLGMCYAT